MIVQQKYLLTLTISHIISALVVINKAHCRLEIQAYVCGFIYCFFKLLLYVLVK